MIVKNCANLLQRCLVSITGLYDYLAIVDTGTTRDDTVQVAQAAATHFSTYQPKWDKPFLDDFAAARNQAMEELDADWLIWVDCDEVFRDTFELRSDIFALPPEMNYFGMYCVLDKLGNKITKIRGTRRGKMKWFKRIHEYLSYGERELIDDKGVLLDHELAHGRSKARGIRNKERNYTILRAGLAENPEDPHYPLCLARELNAQGRIEEANALIQDIDPKTLDGLFGQRLLERYLPMTGARMIQVDGKTNLT